MTVVRLTSRTVGGQASQASPAVPVPVALASYRPVQLSLDFGEHLMSVTRATCHAQAEASDEVAVGSKADAAVGFPVDAGSIASPAALAAVSTQAPKAAPGGAPEAGSRPPRADVSPAEADALLRVSGFGRRTG